MCDDMSEGEYQRMRAECELDIPLPRSHTTWVTREGERISVRKLSDSHLSNIIRMLRRTAEARKTAALLECWSAGTFLHGEMAILSAEQEGDRIEEMDTEDFLALTIPTWDALLNEADRRKLEVPE